MGGGDGQFRVGLDSSSLENQGSLTQATDFRPPSALGDGFHTLFVQERDEAGNWSNPGAYTVLIDLQPPLAPEVSGPILTADNQPSWTWVSGGEGAGVFRFSLNDLDLLHSSTEGTQKRLQPANPLPDGFHILYVQERDSAGNWSEPGQAQIEVDTRPPLAPGLSSPPLTNNPSPLWQWATQAGGTGSFRIILDNPLGIYLAPETQATSFRPINPLQDGVHTLYIQERDTVGNWSTVAQSSSEVDTLAPGPPSVSISTPTNNPRPAWNWSGSNQGAAVYRLGLDDENAVQLSKETNQVFFTPAFNLSDGKHTLYVQERDSAGNWSATAASEVKIDTLPPETPSIESSGSTTQPRPEWSWSSSGGGIGVFRFTLGNATDLEFSPETQSLNFRPLANLEDGLHTLYVQERDAVGNWSQIAQASAEVLVPFLFRPLVFGPILTNNPRPQWTWESSEEGQNLFRVSLNDSQFSVGAVQVQNQKYSPDFNLNDGSHTLFVQQKDQKGNWSRSGSFEVVVDTSPPAPPSLEGESPTSSSSLTWTLYPGDLEAGSFRISHNQAWVSLADSNVRTRSLTLDNLSPGLHVLEVEQADLADNWSDPVSLSLFIDQSPPEPASIFVSTPTSISRPTWQWQIANEPGLEITLRLDASLVSLQGVVESTGSYQPDQNLSDGLHSLSIQLKDSLGNQGPAVARDVLVDTSPPSTAFRITSESGHRPVSLAFVCEDLVSGCANTYLSTDSSIPEPIAIRFPHGVEILSTTTLRYFSVDRAGNVEEMQETTQIVDNKAPTLFALPRGKIYNETQRIEIHCEDESGCQEIFYSLGESSESPSFKLYTAPIEISKDSSLTFFGTDRAGNFGLALAESYIIDTLAPLSVISPQDPDLEFARFLTLGCSDDRAEGCDAIYFRLSLATDSEFSIYREPIAIEESLTVEFYSQDLAGNQEEIRSEHFKVTPLSLGPEDIYLEPGQTHIFEVQGSKDPQWSLSPGQGFLQARDPTHRLYGAPGIAIDETLSVTDHLLGQRVETLVHIHTISPLEILTVEGDPLVSPVSMAAGDIQSYTVHGGASQPVLKLVSAPPGMLGNSIASLTGSSLQLTIPTTGAYSGRYRFEINDPQSGWSRGFEVLVPFTLMPHSVTFMEKTRKNLLEIRGGYPGEVFKIEILDGESLNPLSKSSVFETLESASASFMESLANPAIFAGRSQDIEKLLSFFLVARSRNRPYLPPLQSSRIHLIPGRIYQARIIDPLGNPIEGVKITSLQARDHLDQPYHTASDINGEFSMTLPIITLGDYGFLLERQGFIPLDVEGRDLLSESSSFTINEILMQPPSANLSGEVIGLEAGDEAVLLAHLLHENQGRKVLGRTYVTGDGSGIDPFTIPVDANLRYSRITLRAKGYISSLADNQDQGFDPSLFEFSDIKLVTQKIEPIEIEELSSSEEGIELRISVSRLSPQSFTVEVLDHENEPVSFLDSFLEPEGLRVLLPALTRMNMVLRDMKGKVLRTYSISKEEPNPDLPSGQVPVDLEAGFEQSFESREDASDRVEVEHPGQPSAAEPHKVSFLEVYTREIQSAPAGPGLKSNLRIYEIAVKSVTSQGSLIEISDKRDGLGNLVLTLPFNPDKIPPGELESGRTYIRHAPDLESLAAGDSESVPPEDIMGIDYLNGRVSFKVDHLSVFTLGEIADPPPSSPGEPDPIPPTVVNPGEAFYGSGAGGCFVATASFGRLDHPFVKILIRFRDEFLSKFALGRKFIRNYYRYSPPIASWISKRILAKTTMSLALMPLVILAWLMLNKMAMIVLIFLVLIFSRKAKISRVSN